MERGGYYAAPYNPETDPWHEEEEDPSQAQPCLHKSQQRTWHFASATRLVPPIGGDHRSQILLPRPQQIGGAMPHQDAHTPGSATPAQQPGAPGAGSQQPQAAAGGATPASRPQSRKAQPVQPAETATTANTTPTPPEPRLTATAPEPPRRPPTFGEWAVQQDTAAPSEWIPPPWKTAPPPGNPAPQQATGPGPTGPSGGDDIGGGQGGDHHTDPTAASSQGRGPAAGHAPSRV